jgi:hypothetical protein
VPVWPLVDRYWSVPLTRTPHVHQIIYSFFCLEEFIYRGARIWPQELLSFQVADVLIDATAISGIARLLANALHSEPPGACNDAAIGAASIEHKRKRSEDEHTGSALVPTTSEADAATAQAETMKACSPAGPSQEVLPHPSSSLAQHGMACRIIEVWLRSDMLCPTNRSCKTCTDVLNSVLF